MSKNLRIRAQNVAQEIFDILEVRPSGAQGDKVAQAIEQVIVKALKKGVERSTDAATEIFSTDRRTGDKVAEEIRLANNVLISNLSSMR